MRWWQPLCFSFILLVACHSPAVHQANQVKIHLTKDSQAICISGLDYALMQELKKDSLTRDNWQNIFAVYRMPADTDMKDFQHVQPGSYQINDSVIVFKPDTSFKKHERYFARFYGNGTTISSLKLIQGKADLKGPAYTEATFSF